MKSKMLLSRLFVLNRIVLSRPIAFSARRAISTLVRSASNRTHLVSTFVVNNFRILLVSSARVTNVCGGVWWWWWCGSVRGRGFGFLGCFCTWLHCAVGLSIKSAKTDRERSKR